MDAPTPWYKRDILPAWAPGWLAASLLIALAFAVIFGVFLEDPHPWRVAGVAGLCGFALAVVILSFAAVRYSGPEPNRFAPPAVIRYPVVTFAVVLWPAGWARDRRILARGRRTLVSGDAAEVMGLTVLAMIVAGLLAMFYYRRTGSKRLPVVLSLIVALAAFGYSAVVVIRRHAG
jgi:hypothetical protein